MYAANVVGTVGEGRYGLFLVVRVAVALVLAVAVWFAMMVVAATTGRLVLELGQWVGALVLEVLGTGIRLPLSGLLHALAQIASVWPAFHLGQFARYEMGSGGVDLVPQGLSLVAIAVVFCVIARRGPRKVR
jgi:hypothetical protein